MSKENKKSPVLDEQEKQIDRADGDYKVSTSKYHNAVAKVLCVLAAMVLWFYVVGTSMTVEERVFSGVPVTFKNADVIETNLGMSVISGRDYTVDITLSGAKAELDSLSVDDLNVFADLSNITESGEQSLEIQAKVPGGITVINKSASLIRVYIDKSVSVNVPLKIETLHSTSYSVGAPVANIEQIAVTGPSAELDKIDHALVSLDLGRIDRSTTATGRPILMGKDGSEITSAYVKLQTSDVSVHIPVYAEKDVPLRAAYKYGYFNSDNVTIKLTPEMIRIKADPAELENIKSVDALINEKLVSADGRAEAEIVLPAGAENISSTQKASVKVTHKNTETRKLTVSKLSVINPSNLKCVKQSDKVDIILRGPKEQLSLLTAGSISVTLDLSNVSAGAGSQTLPLGITLPEAVNDSVYEVGTYQMSVYIE